MRNGIVRFLTVSIVCIFALCVVVFSLMAFLMNRRAADGIGELGEMYMADMSEQAAAHFGTTIELRFSQVSSLVDSVPPDSNRTPASIRVALMQNAKMSGFSALSLYGADGNYEVLYGSDIAANDASFLDALTDGERMMSSGKSAKGETYILMGVPASYPMESGGVSVGIVAALPSSYIRKTLSFSANQIYYFIIDRDGEFIICDENVTDENYFSRVENRYDSVIGIEKSAYIDEVRSSMRSGKDFTYEFVIDGEQRFLYGTELSYTDWYLLLFLPYGRLNETVSSLSQSWGWASVMSCVVILLAFVVVFVFYFRLTRRQVRELEEARGIAEHASKAKSEFLSNMSHDIRTPMNAIVGMTAIASSNPDDSEQVRNCLKKIDLSSRHLLNLINDILDLSKIESGKLELNMDRMSLCETLRSVLNIVQTQAHAKGQRFDVFIGDLPYEYVECDTVRFSQILINLLGNAVKFTPSDGNISLSCREELSPSGDAFTRVLFTVKDDGIGMTKEFKEKIFDAFAREDSGRVQKTEGSGLGMTITKYIVDAMHGTIEVESELNRGTEFRVCLDLRKAESEEEPLPAWDVLVLHRDGQVRENIAASLNAIGCNAECAEDEASALEKIALRHGRGEDYRAVLFGGADACALAEKFREACGGNSTLLLLASEWGEGSDRMKEAGISGVLGMPVFRSDLRRVLKQRCGADELPAPEEDVRPAFDGKRILLAEDNDLNREIAEELLTGLGLSIDHAENGKVCLEKFESSPEFYYDAILMDIRMPVMSGYEATEAIRALPRADSAIPIIAMSADAFSDDVKHCLECGMNAHTAKPIDMEIVSRVLAQFLGNGRKGENS